MQDFADAVLTSLEITLTRIDDSDDESQLIVPTWRDVDSGTGGLGSRSVRARIGEVASPGWILWRVLCWSQTTNHWSDFLMLVLTTRGGLSPSEW